MQPVSYTHLNAHTTFNIVCTLIWLPLIPLMVKIVTTIIRGTEKQRDDGPVSVLESGVIAQPAAALYLVSEELEHMAEVGSKLLTALKESFSSDKTQSEAATEQYRTYRRQAARMEDDLAAYVTKMLSSGNLTQQQSGQAAGLLYCLLYTSGEGAYQHNQFYVAASWKSVV